jgi:hypothetical protein
MDVSILHLGPTRGSTASSDSSVPALRKIGARLVVKGSLWKHPSNLIIVGIALLLIGFLASLPWQLHRAHHRYHVPSQHLLQLPDASQAVVLEVT